MAKKSWGAGQKTKLAAASGVQLSYLVDILRGRRRATPENAATISTQAHLMGLDLDRMDLIYPRESLNPLIEIPWEERE